MNTKTRDIGLNHQNGKGSADRSNRKKFAARFPAALTGEVAGFEQRGRRLIKVYGPRGGSRPATRHVLWPEHLDSGYSVAQALADQQNAAFRAAGVDTLGH